MSEIFLEEDDKGVGLEWPITDIWPGNVLPRVIRSGQVWGHPWWSGGSCQNDWGRGQGVSPASSIRDHAPPQVATDQEGLSDELCLLHFVHLVPNNCGHHADIYASTSKDIIVFCCCFKKVKYLLITWPVTVASTVLCSGNKW